MTRDEQPLTGNVTAGVVRVGDTVRRPVGPWTDSVDALLRHLHEVGFPGAPRPLGRDAAGRQVLEYVPGETGPPEGTYAPAELASIGALLADLHRATADFVPPAPAVWNRVIPPDGEELVCHHDAAPWNLVRSPRGWVLIDWDSAGPGTRLWELAYAAQSMAGMGPDRPARESAERLRIFVDGYGLSGADRPALAGMLGRRARAMYDLLCRGAREGRQPWARIHTEDGAYWRATAEHLDAHVRLWTSALE
ncbi:Ser/Thr protein kinase RdoA involved in Cpx stress response, MazF antagonist [Micromonospora rhizosphaerae]|uniref:Ser/Thr protein kinase RdoA involved in Cpx stress response, MazF antagonist n=1 Tax=Micromonospora rhizosphaerae TaxID=568872 RepID=A0A1C6SVH2_9ACTN|nr:phosphotransferase [Micromonospora rhizosphaerae]SCL33531.1 Ser/Thr protein kinase RdoA involved in Cpx stress response, MazF antagonist [Micromonospora rhizosphaerae]